MADPYSRPAPTSSHPQPVNGYPSSAAYAPPTNLYYYNSQAPPYPNPRATLLRRVIAGIIVATVLFFTIFFICWLVIRPHRPQFHLTHFSVSNLKISNSSQTLSANWNARFQVYNPNKKLKISYDHILFSLLYKSEILSQTRIPPFYQGTKNLTSFEASFSALDTYVEDWALRRINEEKSRGVVDFNLRMVSDVGFKVGGVRARRRSLRVWCDTVGVGLTANTGTGNLTGGARDCRVYV